jgi:hypothetical protein
MLSIHKHLVFQNKLPFLEVHVSIGTCSSSDLARKTLECISKKKKAITTTMTKIKSKLFKVC